MSGIKRWILVRHGDTEWTEKNKLHGGRFDSPLSSRGRLQAELTGTALKDERIRSIFSSPQGRALQTAEIIGNQVNIDQIYPVEGLREQQYGLLEGGPILTFGPDGTAPRILKPFTSLVKNLTGESNARFIARISGGLTQVQEFSGEGTILIVSHWGALSAMMSLLFKGNESHWLEDVKWSPCGITTIQNRGDHWEVMQQDRTDHLERKG